LNIHLYHWVWYLIGLIVYPQLTFMIFLSLYVKGIPIILMIVGWIIAIFPRLKLASSKLAKG